MAKIGIMSFAHMHAYAYAECLGAITDAEMTAVWDDRPARGRAAAKQFGVRYYRDAARFLNSGIDGVIVCSENVRHRAMVEAAAKAGLWILCEKPLATTTRDARAMIRACERSKVGLGTAFPCRFVPALRSVRDAAHRGDYGTIHAAACTNNGSYPGGWFAKKDLSGGGAVMDHTVHVADVLRWITGREFTRVFCEMATLFRPRLDVDDYGSLHLEMDDGLIVSHIASWNRPKSFPTWGDVTLDLRCDVGTVRVDAFNRKLDVYSDKDPSTEWAYWGYDSNLGLVQDFVDAIRHRRDPASTGLDGLKALEVTLAAYRSARLGRMLAL